VKREETIAGLALEGLAMISGSAGAGSSAVVGPTPTDPVEFRKCVRDLKTLSTVQKHTNEERGGSRDPGVRRLGAGRGQLLFNSSKYDLQSLCFHSSQSLFAFSIFATIKYDLARFRHRPFIAGVPCFLITAHHLCAFLLYVASCGKTTVIQEAWMRGSGFLRHSDPDLVWQPGLQSQLVAWAGMQVWRQRNALHVCVDCGDRKMRPLGRRALALNSSRLHTRYCMNVRGVCVKSWNITKQKQDM